MIKLSDFSTHAPKNVDKDAIKEATKKYAKRIGELITLLQAERKRSVLIVLQGIDGSGKDGTTKAIFADTSPAYVRVHAYKKPTEEEFAHDFLWRIHKHAPEKGYVSVFNRSHYEDVLIQRVHGWIDENRVQNRIEAINAFEKLLQFDNNTLIIKFYMHLSFDEQFEELKDRVKDPAKNWKHSEGDWEERKLWSEYMKVYEDTINRTNGIEWHILPCDQEWYRAYFATKTVCEALENLNMKSPTLSDLELAHMKPFLD
jgi:PPK2 family polyphosphate:nucleotide phosphotransferase